MSAQAAHAGPMIRSLPKKAAPNSSASGQAPSIHGTDKNASPATIRSRSAAFTEPISSGRLRNHGQNIAHHSRPSPAMTQNGVVQAPKATNSHRKMNELIAPPRRLNVHTRPWANPRSLGGIQS